MANSKAVDKETKKMGIGKIVLIVLIVFTTIPVMIMSIIYFTNEDFKFIANKYLSNIAGPIGMYFESYPTREEREEQKREVAKYLVGLDIESASDKLTIIQKEDEKLYLDLIKIMTQMDAKQTNKIFERVRQNSIKKDILVSTLEQMKHDQIKKLQDKAKYYENISLVNAIDEIKNNLLNEIVSYKEMGLIIEQMKEEFAAKILKNLDKEVALRLLSNYESNEKRKKMKKILSKINDREKELINIANIYNSERADKLLSDIGNDKKYKLNELSIIYRNMNMIQAAQVLSKVEDKDFTYRLLEQMKIDEMLAKGNDLLTPDIMNAVKVYREYNKEIDDLVKVFGKMESREIGNMITKLFKSRSTPKKYTFDNGDQIVISDQDIAISILKKLKEKTVADVLTTIDKNLASEISKKLALP
ncbi:hypothetical protein FQB35_07730 [Crassaminicella thermophila]|uniref:Flagellar motility protein MotE, a chaperone for MotC folding n=1 Tax=Crassaminicella thermophila TaxID=2599308 RepID=A0A5C0SCL8_CRATE|nr:hypothetical protein [Crassaminicella thermophila]QEK12275.1 hypothetical protein FQB35_07730 [Crassaminicella thermophila]